MAGVPVQGQIFDLAWFGLGETDLRNHLRAWQRKRASGEDDAAPQA
jgi:hypothetical protein